jgi:hypothetical protein
MAMTMIMVMITLAREFQPSQTITPVVVVSEMRWRWQLIKYCEI